MERRETRSRLHTSHDDTPTLTFYTALFHNIHTDREPSASQRRWEVYTAHRARAPRHAPTRTVRHGALRHAAHALCARRSSARRVSRRTRFVSPASCQPLHQASDVILKLRKLVREHVAVCQPVEFDGCGHLPRDRRQQGCGGLTGGRCDGAGVRPVHSPVCRSGAPGGAAPELRAQWRGRGAHPLESGGGWGARGPGRRAPARAGRRAGRKSRSCWRGRSAAAPRSHS